ncbi:MAG: ATP-binding protein, partial [Planktomarina sp.]
DPVLWIHADRARLQHILMNLVGNAVKFTSKGAIMVVAQALDEDRVKITVNDTGVGIDADFKARIFDDFVTGDTSYVRQVGGTGLGLGIAKRFVTALGGEIGVDSQEGQGSQFWITFPITRIAEPMTLTQQPDPNTKFGCHVLLVEDNEINRFVAHEMLKAAGHTVVEAENGEIGVDRTKTEAFDLILMDISMPVMDGRNATKAIRGAPGPNQTTPIVALTANAMAAEQQAFLRDGMNAILTKPLSRDALAAAIQVHVDTTLGQPSHENVPDDLRQIMDEQELSLLLKRFDQEGGDLIDWLLGDEVTDLAEVQHRTHKVAGSAAIFGPTELRQAMIDLENAAKAGDRDAVQKNIAMVEQVWRVSRPIPQAT